MKRSFFFSMLIAVYMSTRPMIADSGRGTWIAGNVLGGVGAALAGPGYYGPYNPYYYPYPYYGPYYGSYYDPYWGRPYVGERRYGRDGEGKTRK